MKEGYRHFLLIGLVISGLLLPSSSRIHAQDNPKGKVIPGVQLLLLSEDEPTEPNIVFVTSAFYTGDLGGLVGADKKCEALAEAAGLPKNTYKAWLSTSSVNAIDRLGDARGWVRVDGKPFADTKADIAAGKIFHPIRVDELGNSGSLLPSLVWTGTKGDGTLFVTNGREQTCSNWFSLNSNVWGWLGINDGVAESFTYHLGQPCTTLERLYCFGVDNYTPVAVKPAAGRIAFVTRDTWDPSTGLRFADAKCKTEAQQAGLSGRFKALLAHEGASAASRFDVNGLPWVRPDGVMIAPTAADLFSADYLDAAINQSADGLEYYDVSPTWTGALTPTTPGTPETTCKNWTSSSYTDWGMAGNPSSTFQEHFFARYENGSCAGSKHLYCLQE